MMASEETADAISFEGGNAIRETRRLTFFATTWGELRDAVESITEAYLGIPLDAPVEFSQAGRTPDTDESIAPRVQCISIEYEKDIS